ncbi:MAG TPA: efflux RND transporter periplasmic adaptor subunit [Gemmatimonadales bacterium]|nr:efflux RND transporter periplasmic adaptor subunit [Gemmatimonadales bacterium]
MTRSRSSRIVLPSPTHSLALGTGLVALLALVACGPGKAPPRPSVPVAVATVLRQDTPVILAATGTVEPIQTAAVQSQVDGIITHIAFREGQEVAAGQVLFEIDPRSYRARLEGAEAALARDASQLAQAERDYARFSDLGAKNYVTTQQVDQAQVQVSTLRATVRADSAALAQARLDLGFASVRAPIGGRAGAVLLREGNLARANSASPLVVINQLAPIQARFALPATDLPELRAKAGRTLPVTALTVGDSGAPSVGTLTFVDNAVDTLTGTITLKAIFPNGDHRLWPGSLVRVQLQIDVEKGALVVPLPAVVSGQRGSSVFVVDSAGKAKNVAVTVRRTTDSLAILSGGVTAGQTVVTDGQIRLTDGTPVEAKH